MTDYYRPVDLARGPTSLFPQETWSARFASDCIQTCAPAIWQLKRLIDAYSTGDDMALVIAETREFVAKVRGQ